MHHHKRFIALRLRAQVMADVSAALPSESALRKERQARWDSDVSQGSSHEDKVRGGLQAEQPVWACGLASRL